MKFLTNVQQMIIYRYQGILFLQSCISMLFFTKRHHFLLKKSVSNFFGSQSGKMKLIFLIYTFFKASVQKIGNG